MPYVLHLRLLVPNSPLNSLHNTFICMLDGYGIQNTTVHSNSCPISLKKPRFHSDLSSTMRFRVNVGERMQFAFQPKRTASLSWNYSIDEDIQVDNVYMDCDKELERRRKIGLANKGKEPWNKGRKHSAETRELIRRRTIEALRDPKVRQKMSSGHHAHSDESKARIGLGQKKVWRKRMMLKNIKERFYHIWAEGIAEAAKKGWFDQEELEWDSYEKLATEMSLKQLQFAADKERAKTMAKLRAAREKAERMARRALLLKEKEEKEKLKVPMKKKTRRKSKDGIKEAPISKGLKLKARITKIRHKKSVEGQVTIAGEVTSVNNHPDIENLDLEFIKREKLRRELSLADQIQAAKKKRLEYPGSKEIMTKTSSSFIMNGRVEQLVSTVSNKD